METEQLLDAFRRFAADLTVAGQPVAIDFVVDKHLDLFAEARASGLRWPGFAELLFQAGAVRVDGTALTADQIRASYSRVQRRHRTRPLAPVKPDRVLRDFREETAQARSPPISSRAAPSRQAPNRVGDDAAGVDPDLSDAELRAARRRLGDL